MVCNFVIEYTNANSSAIASTGISWTTNIDPPEEIAGKECILKLVSSEISDVPINQPLTSTTVLYKPKDSNTFNGGITWTNANPAVFTSNGHGLSNGNAFYFTSLGGGTGPSLGSVYFVVNAATNTFQLSNTVGGTALNGLAYTTTTGASGVGIRDTTAVFTWPGHNLAAGTQVVLTTIGNGSGPTANTTYYVSQNNLLGDTFQLQSSNGTSVICYQLNTTAGYATAVANQLASGPRIPLSVKISGLTQKQSRWCASTLTTVSDAVNSTFVGFAAINGSTPPNPSIHCFMPLSPQQWTVSLNQLGLKASYLGGYLFSAVLMFQISPITKA